MYEEDGNPTIQPLASSSEVLLCVPFLMKNICTMSGKRTRVVLVLVGCSPLHHHDNSLWVRCRSSRLNQNKPFTEPVLTLMSSSAEFYRFSLSGRLRVVRLNALTRLSTIIYVNCTIKSLNLLRQCDFDNLINKQFESQKKCWHICILSLVRPCPT